MKLGKLLIAVTTVTMLLGALVGSASARNFSFSSQASRATFARLDFAGGFGTVECEVVIAGTMHSRSMTKTVGTLIGYITAGNVTRCARGGATINRASLPWHERFASFTGTLPNIRTVSITIFGFSATIREPIFGLTCSVTVTTPSLIKTYTVGAGGVVTGGSLGATGLSCGLFSFGISGPTVDLSDNINRITLTLI